MFGQIGTLLVDTVFTFFVFLLLGRFLLQWLRVSFRNPVGEFLIATTNWIVAPARRVIPGLAGLDLASLLLAWLLQGLAIWLQGAIVGADLAFLSIALVAALDLVRFTIYILVFAVVVQVVFSWINPEAPLAPVFDAITRPFLRPLRRFIPPIARVDLTPLVLFVILQLLLIPIRYFTMLAASVT